MLVLIGENNAGKSNILEALSQFFNAGKLTLGPEFFCTLGEPCLLIEITLTFNELTDDEKERFSEHIESDIFRVKRIASRSSIDESGELGPFLSIVRRPRDPLLDVPKSGVDSGHLKNLEARYQLPAYVLGTHGKPTITNVKQNWERLVDDLAQKDGMSEEFREARILGYTQVAQGNLPKFLWLPAVRDVSDELKTTQKSLFGSIFFEVMKESASASFASRITVLLNEIRSELNVSQSETKEEINPIRELENELNTLFNQHMPDTTIHLLFDVPNLEELMWKGSFVEIDDGVRSRLEHKGHGMQRLFIFMLLRAYAMKIVTSEAKTGRSFILAIEEPEIYLHPPAQRQLLQVLSMISTQQQVLLCTHSPYFIEMFRYREVAVVSRESRTSPTKVFQSTDDIFRDNEKDAFKLLSKVDPTRSELFFSKKVVLVEGDTERMIIPMIGEKMQYNFPLDGITVIEAGGKTVIPFFSKIMNTFGIKYLVIHDEDPVEPSEDDPKKLKSARRLYEFNETIKASIGSTGALLMVEGNFETLLGVSRKQADRKGKPLAAFERIDEMAISDLPDYFIEGLKRFLDS